MTAGTARRHHPLRAVQMTAGENLVTDRSSEIPTAVLELLERLSRRAGA